MDLTSLPRLARNTGRFGDVVAVLAKYGLAPWIQRVHIEWMQRLFRDSTGKHLCDLSQEVRIRQALTELGTTFIKLGQILSTRPDLVGPELSAELQKLQSNTPADCIRLDWPGAWGDAPRRPQSRCESAASGHRGSDSQRSGDHAAAGAAGRAVFA